MDLQSLQIERRPSAPLARRRGGNPWPLRAGLLLLVGGAAWLFLPKLTALADRMRLPAVKTMVLQAPAAAAAAATTGTAANGYVVAARRAALSSDVPGRIVAMMVKEGSVVKRGDIVAQLFSDEYRAALERSKADLAVAAEGIERATRIAAAAASEEQQAKDAVATATAQLDEARALNTWAVAELQRVEDLLQQGIGSPRDVDRARADQLVAAARVASLGSSVRAATTAAATAALRIRVADADLRVATAQQQAAQAGVQQAQATLDKTDVRAPFDGVVVLKDAEVGEVVSPNSQGGSTARGAVCTLVDFDSLEIQAHVPETALGSVQKGGECAVFLDAEAERRLAGEVDRIWPTADRQKATVEVRIRLRERSEVLRPEMTVRVVFLAADRAGQSPAGQAVPADASAPVALLVPETALVDHQGGSAAFVVERDTVRLVTLKVGERRSGRAAVTGGLRPGQRLVLDPPASLRDGDRVQFADG